MAMDPLLRILYRHMRTIWFHTRTLFLSIRFRRLRTSTSGDNHNQNTSTASSTATYAHRPPTPMPASSRLTVLSTAKTRAYQWACAHGRELKTQMKERRAARRKSIMKTKQVVYSRMAAAAVVGQGKGDVAGAARTSKCCKDDFEEDEGAEAQGDNDGDDLDEFDALFKSLSSSPTLRLDTWRVSTSSPFPPSTPGPLITSAPLDPDLRFKFEMGGYAAALQSPTMSCASFGSCDTSAPVTPVTPTTTPLGFHFPSTINAVDAATPSTLRVNPRPPHTQRSRTNFSTLSASITARSPLSLSFPLSLSLPLAARRASSPGTVIHRCMQNGGCVGAGQDREGEDPFGTHGRAYYAPGARAALGLGDAYDLSAWTWACECSPYRDTKKRKRHVRTERQCSVRTDPTMTKTSSTVVVAGGGGGNGDSTVPGTSGSVYRAPSHAESAPQLSYTQQPDKELEYLCALANARVQESVTKPPEHECASARDRAPRYRSGIRPLLLPQKLGLTGSGVPARETGKANALNPGGRRHKATGWEVDLERGARGDGDGAEE